MTPLYDTSIDWSKPPTPPDWEGLKRKQDKQLSDALKRVANKKISDALKFSDAKIPPTIAEDFSPTGRFTVACASGLSRYGVGGAMKKERYKDAPTSAATVPESFHVY